MTVRRVGIVTTSRADYGALVWLLREVQAHPGLELLLFVTGTHLSPEFGMSVRAIEADGFPIRERIEMLLSSDTAVGATKSVGAGLLGFADAFQRSRPDVLVLFGDRTELWAPAIAALLQQIPVAHIHGGETSQGAVDEAVRHSVTKIASIHFPAADAYRRRIIQLGEDPDRVFAFGALGLDGLHRASLLSQSDLEERLGFALAGTVAIVTFHPVTLEPNTALAQLEHVLRAIEKSGIKAVFTQANADAEGRHINNRLRAFCAAAPERYRLYDTLGQLVYLSCLKHVQLMIGNSSSGLIEAPSLRLPVVNVGDRQRGRLAPRNVISVAASYDEIFAGIDRATSSPFLQSLEGMGNPYDPCQDGKVGYRIAETLYTVDLSPGRLKKVFHDVAIAEAA